MSTYARRRFECIHVMNSGKHPRWLCGVSISYSKNKRKKERYIEQEITSVLDIKNSFSTQSSVLQDLDRRRGKYWQERVTRNSGRWSVHDFLFLEENSVHKYELSLSLEQLWPSWCLATTGTRTIILKATAANEHRQTLAISLLHPLHEKEVAPSWLLYTCQHYLDAHSPTWTIKTNSHFIRPNEMSGQI